MELSPSAVETFVKKASSRILEDTIAAEILEDTQVFDDDGSADDSETVSGNEDCDESDFRAHINYFIGVHGLDSAKLLFSFEVMKARKQLAKEPALKKHRLK